MANLYHGQTLGEAKKYAQEWANRDDCGWKIWKGAKATEPYLIADEFAEKPLWANRLITTIQPAAKSKKEIVDPRGEPVYLTKEEKAIVAAVLDPKEIGRDYFPGDEKTKIGLRLKLLAGMEFTLDFRPKV